MHELLPELPGAAQDLTDPAMRRSTLALLRCPQCQASLSVSGNGSEEIEEGSIDCPSCAESYPITSGIARFVGPTTYADNFGLQWKLFRRTQLDSHTGQPISRDRFLNYTGWTEADLSGSLVLDAGCGAGRFAEVALSMGARVIALDYSDAIEAAQANLAGRGDIDFIQADINALPFEPGTFPFAYCLGVIQHTPDPAKGFHTLARVVQSGGRLAVDVYPAHWKNFFFAKYWIRPLTRRMSAQTTLQLVNRIFPALYGLSSLLCRIPIVGHYLRYAVPVANYRGVYPLDERQLREWALLDTFDMWAPAYDKPQKLETLRSWFHDNGFSGVEAFHEGFFVGRGRKAA